MAHGYSSPTTAAVRGPRPEDAPLFILILISIVQPVALNMYVPAMADMRGDLNASASAIQATLSCFLAATALGQLVIGPLSDIKGRRPVFLAGMSLFIAGTIVCVVASSVTMLIVGRILQGFGGCAGLALSRAIIRDIHGTATSASMIGYVTMGMALAPLIAPAIGGFIYEAYSWQAIFVAMGALGVLAFVVAFWRMKETHRPTKTSAGAFRSFSREARELSKLRQFWLYALTLASLCVAFFTFVAGGAFVAVDVFGLSASGYGLYFILVVSGYVLGNFVTGRFGPRIGLVRLIVIGNATALLGVLAGVVLSLAGSTHPLSLFVPMFVVGIGNGFALPNCVAGCVSIEPRLAGTASGVAGAFQVGSGAVASVVVGLIIEFDLAGGTIWAVLVPMTLGSLAAFALSFTLLPPPGMDRPNPPPDAEPIPMT